MKKYFLTILVIIITLSGCNQTTWEEVYIENGSFSFEYPSEWIHNSENTVQTTDWKHLEAGGQFLFWVNPPGSGFEYLINELGNTKISLDGIKTTKYLASGPFGNTIAAIIKFEKDSNFYFLKYEFTTTNENEKDKYFKILDHIIETFDFKEST